MGDSKAGYLPGDTYIDTDNQIRVLDQKRFLYTGFEREFWNFWREYEGSGTYIASVADATTELWKPLIRMGVVQPCNGLHD